MSKHGTISKYTGGCRCKRCRGANAEYQRAYQARRKAGTRIISAATTSSSTWPPATIVGWTDTSRIVAGSTIVATTTDGLWSVDVRTPMERLVDACIDLREAFAAYHQAHTEPVA